jgi:two-component system, NtrC family, response regulator PilR
MTLRYPAVRVIHDSLEAFIGKLRRKPELIKDLRPNILVTGETGTGKELVATALKLRLIRERLLAPGDDCFGTVNCACLPASLLEIELFGTTKEAFTGAGDQVGLVPRLAGFKKIDSKKGLSGSDTTRPALLFLDEIGATTPKVQAKLLRLVENREFSPLGLAGRGEKAPYLMILAATNELHRRKPADAAKSAESTTAATPCACNSAAGTPRFRLDLFYRLCDTFHFHLPPLSERQEEIPLIAEQFYQKYFQKFFDPQASPKLPEQVADVLAGCSWPGNGRQLHQVVRRAMLLWNRESAPNEDEATSALVDLFRKECAAI